MGGVLIYKITTTGRLNMLHQLFRYYEIIVLDHPKKLLALMGCLTLLAALQVPNLFIETSSDSLVLEGDTDLRYYQEVRQRYPEKEFLIAAYTPKIGGLLESNNVRRLTALVDELKRVAGVDTVNSIIDVPLITATKSSLDAGITGTPTLRAGNVAKDAVAREFRHSPLYKDLVADKALSTAAVQILLTENQEYRQLFTRREHLRHIKKSSGLTKVQAIELKEIEQSYLQLTKIFQTQRNVLIVKVREILESYRDNANIFLGGVPMITADMVRYVRSDLVVFGSSVGFMVMLLLLVIFRDWRWVFVPLLCCAMSSLFALGFLIAIEWPINIVSANFLLLVFVLTLAINIHLIVRYRELQASAPDTDHYILIQQTLRYMITPCTYMVLTTVISFLALYFSRVRPVIDFGIMMALSCVILLIWSFLIFPSALMLCSKPRPEPDVLDPSKSMTRCFTWAADKLGTSIIWIYVLAATIGVYGISQLKVESRFIDYFAKNTEIYQGMEVIDKYLGGTIPFEILITQPTESTEDEDDFDFGTDKQASTSPWVSNYGMKRIKQVHDYMDSLPESGKVLSLGVLYDIMEEYLGRPPDDVELAVIKESLPEEVQDLLVRSYLSDDGSETRIALRVKETSRDLERGKFIHKVRTDLEEMLNIPPEHIKMTGLLVLYNNLLQSLYKSQVLTLGVVTIIIFCMFLVLFRSVLIAAIAILPNFLAASLVLGLMGFIGTPLDMVTVVVATLLIGIGVDDTVHYVWRFKQEFAKNRNYTAAMHLCHGSVGRALSYTSITIVLGLMLLVLSNFTPSIRFGVFTSIAMIIALCGTMVLLPQIFKMVQPFGPEEK